SWLLFVEPWERRGYRVILRRATRGNPRAQRDKHRIGAAFAQSAARVRLYGIGRPSCRIACSAVSNGVA
ncbi:hypothetical protein M3669_12780, partial [Staphylococcus capitis]|nr:hypothetical protein [Staphylococcus capitis]